MSSLDENALKSIRDLQSEDDPHVLVTLIDLFLKTASERLESIENAAAHAQGSMLEAAAHSLKSSSASLGMVNVAATCAELEKLGKQNDWVNTHSIAKRLRREFEAAVIELNHLPEMKARQGERKVA